MKMKSIEESTEKKSCRRAILKKARKVLAIFVAMAIDKHLDYDQDENINRGNRKEIG